MCVYTIESKWTMQMTFDPNKTPLTHSLADWNKFFLAYAWPSIIDELEGCEALDCMQCWWM